jgi:hypothetical protein
MQRVKIVGDEVILIVTESAQEKVFFDCPTT